MVWNRVPDRQLLVGEAVLREAETVDSGLAPWLHNLLLYELEQGA